MRLPHAGFVSALLLASSGCSDPNHGSANAPASAVSTTSSAAASASGHTAVNEPAIAGSALAIAVRPGAMHAGYLGVKDLRERGWFKITDALPADVGQPIEELTKKCGAAPWSLVDDVAWSGGSEREIVVVATLAAPPEKVLACIANVAPGGTPMTGADPGVRFGGMAVVVHHGMLVAGAGKSFDDVLADVPTGPSALLARITPKAGQILRIVVDTRALKGAPVDDVDVTLTSSATAMSTEIAVRARDEASAADLEQKARAAVEQMASMKEAAGFPPVKVSRDGALVRFGLAKEGGATDQAAVLGTMSAIGVYGVRRYLQSAKVAEAKNTISGISRAVVGWAEGDGTHARHKCPPSAPPVPKDIPAGVKYASSDADWTGTWRDIHFGMVTPQYYRYRIDTAPGGKKCTIIAEGDLDGDGVTSKITFDIEFDAQGNPKPATELNLSNEFE